MYTLIYNRLIKTFERNNSIDSDNNEFEYEIKYKNQEVILPFEDINELYKKMIIMTLLTDCSKYYDKDDNNIFIVPELKRKFSINDVRKLPQFKEMLEQEKQIKENSKIIIKEYNEKLIKEISEQKIFNSQNITLIILLVCLNLLNIFL